MIYGLDNGSVLHLAMEEGQAVYIWNLEGTLE